MNEVTMIGVDLAKSVFQAHGATATGEPVFRKNLSRGQFLKFLSEHPNCVVAMKACACRTNRRVGWPAANHSLSGVRPVLGAAVLLGGYLLWTGGPQGNRRCRLPQE